MLINNNKKELDDALLLSKFNDRDCVAFSKIYSFLYNDLHYFANSLYEDTEIEACDIIHDSFVKLWDNKRLKFDEIKNIKAYLVISIKNGFKNYIHHRKYIDTYEKEKKKYDDDFFVVNIAEMDTFSAVSQALDILPEECAKVFKLYVDGWSVKDIAGKLSKAESTVYTQKNEAIKLLKNKFYKTFSFIF